MIHDARQSDIDRRNSEFWNELCGTVLAKSLGIDDLSPGSLEKFDRHYLDLYPYLGRHLGVGSLAGKRVLEVGLGYGTVAQLIAEVAESYQGLDIAPGPVEIVRHRLGLKGYRGGVTRGSILAAPFTDASFDAVISIGCLHHAGNLPLAVNEVYRLLKPGGRATVMVYNAFSYRRWRKNPAATIRMFLRDYLRIDVVRAPSSAERAAYDTGSTGAAPETVFTSARRMRALCRRFSSCIVVRENADRRPRTTFRTLLLKRVGPRLGLDLYVSLWK